MGWIVELSHADEVFVTHSKTTIHKLKKEKLINEKNRDVFVRGNYDRRKPARGVRASPSAKRKFKRSGGGTTLSGRNSNSTSGECEFRTSQCR
jgi:hypothetical protein